MRRLSLLLGFLLLAVPAVARQAPQACRTHFHDGELPDPVPKAAPGTRLLCYSAFATFHSGDTRTALWSAEHLTQARIRKAEALSRPDPAPFHTEALLPPGRRAEPRDYRKSGFDQGHVAPNGDMPTPKAQRESFSLANMVPQDPCNNRRLWRAMEDKVRGLAEEGADLYVVTGPIFEADPPETIGRGVKVPSHLFKAVLNAETGAAAAYVVLNNAVTDVRVVSIAALVELTGVDVFPTLAEDTRQAAAELPHIPPATEACDLGN